VGIYGGPTLGQVTLTGALAYGAQKNKSQRTLDFGGGVDRAQASFDGHEIMGALRASVATRLSDITLTPQAGFQYDRLHEDAFTETGAGSLDLSVGAQDYESLRALAGLDASKAYDLGGDTILTPMVGLNVSGELMGLDPAVSASFEGSPVAAYTVAATAPNAFFVGYSAGAQLSLSRGLSFFAQYRGGVGGSQSSNAFNGGAYFNF
jgi:outer membrane autotransporter protein